MSDHDPYGEPTRADVPVTDPTTAMPATSGGPPLPPGPPPTDEPPEGAPDRRGWILAGLFALVLLIGLAALLLSDDDDDESADATTTTTTEATTTTSTSASTTTTEGTTTTEATTTTTEATTTTAARTCDPSTSANDPDATVTALYGAYVDDDRECAEQLGTADAVADLFAIPGDGGGWTYQGCMQVGSGDPEMDCAYSFEGGATHFRVVYSETEGWQVIGVFQTTD